MEWILDTQIWIGLLTLTALEIVLGIDNIVFISILAGRLPRGSQKKARICGLALAMIMRVRCAPIRVSNNIARKRSPEPVRAVLPPSSRRFNEARDLFRGPRDPFSHHHAEDEFIRPANAALSAGGLAW